MAPGRTVPSRYTARSPRAAPAARTVVARDCRSSLFLQHDAGFGRDRERDALADSERRFLPRLEVALHHAQQRAERQLDGIDRGLAEIADVEQFAAQRVASGAG